MIKLFSAPQGIVDFSSFDHLLHGSVVKTFEERFAEYVGAKYACSFNSATSAIFLILKRFPEPLGIIEIPSIIPPVVLNAIITSGHRIRFTDNTDWVGHSYTLHTYGHGMKIIDSAQRVDRDQFRKEAEDNDIMVFSFYPTKPVGGCDGGMVVSNNKAVIEDLQTASLNGMAFTINSWERKPAFPGYKMYMNSVQAQIAFKSLMSLDDRKESLKNMQEYYNGELGLNNTSYHLYRIKILNNNLFIEYMKNKGIQCGKHYAPAHLMSPYQEGSDQPLPLSEETGVTTVSIPYHDHLSLKDAQNVVKAIKSYGS